MYHGQDSRPNTLVTILTANAPELSTDMAQRAVQIKIGRPTYQGDFRAWAFEFIDQHRWTIIAELLAILQGPPVEAIEGENRSRWGGWMDGVLSRVHNANALAVLINQRRGEFDADADEAAEIAGAIRQLLERHRHEPARVRAFIPGKTMASLIRLANLIEASATQRRATSIVRQQAGSGDLAPLRAHIFGPNRMRGWLWSGPDAAADAEIVEIPIEEILG
jgi:hypothetical protein